MADDVAVCQHLLERFFKRRQQRCGLGCPVAEPDQFIDRRLLGRDPSPRVINILIGFREMF